MRRRGLDPETRETFQPRLWFIVVALALIVAYLAVFIAENNKSVTIHFVYSAHTSVIWVILLSLAIGVIGGVLLSQLYRRRRRSESG